MAIELEKRISVGTVIDYYDGPLIFTAYDKVGTAFLCTFLENSGDGTEYLCVPISGRRLESFLKGNEDLRSVYTSPETEDYYKLVATDNEESELKATLIDFDSIPQSLLPAEGYTVTRDTRKPNGTPLFLLSTM